jgi:MoaA/NifB/PqqE/SkfB family radical SAM enzyme
MRSVTIVVNERCPLRCRHCSVGFSEAYRGNSYRIEEATLISIIEGIDPAVYGAVLFAGGEPSLDPLLVKTGVDACRKAGLASSMITAPIWASSAESAEKLLDQVEGLREITLSFDLYHLEFLKFKHYEIATRHAVQRGIHVQFHITYSKEPEKAFFMTSLDPILSLIDVSFMRAVPVGNAATQVDMEYVTVESAADFDAIPRGCFLGKAIVDSKLQVHGCCWSSLGEKSPFSSGVGENPPSGAFTKMENSPVFQAVMKDGFIDSLSERGKQLLLDRVRGQRFATECDLCVATMKEGSESVWRECGRRVPVEADLEVAVKV